MLQVRMGQFRPDESRSGRWKLADGICRACGEGGGPILACGYCDGPVHEKCIDCCGACGKGLCSPCQPRWAHRCADRVAEEEEELETDEEDLETEGESSDNQDSEEEDVERAVINLAGPNAGEEEMLVPPDGGLLLNRNRATIHRALRGGEAAGCGCKFREGTVSWIQVFPEVDYNLCRRRGCFPEEEDSE